MTYRQIDASRKEWVQRVRSSLGAQGYYYEPEFSAKTDDAEPLVTAARLLGHLYVPSHFNPGQPVILTQPSPSATEWRPFDRRKAIGWHNDFSTRVKRPELTLSWIRQGDPSGPSGGAWRIASVSALLSKLNQTREGKKLITELSHKAEPFGYRDAGGWRLFRIIVRTNLRLRHPGLRFYGRALEEGALLRFGQVPERTCEIIAQLEEAADAVGEVLTASTGALLIVDNRLSLHDRTEQQVTGPKELRRQAWLCFVKQLYQPL
jgi:hypothetical protein